MQVKLCQKSEIRSGAALHCRDVLSVGMIMLRLLQNDTIHDVTSLVPGFLSRSQTESVADLH